MLDQKEIAFHNFQPFTKYNLQSQGFFYCLAEVHKCTVGTYSLTGLKNIHQSTIARTAALCSTKQTQVSH